MSSPSDRFRFLPSDDSDQMIVLAVMGAIASTAHNLGRFYAERLQRRFGNAWRRQLPIAPPSDSQLWDPAKTFIYAVNNQESLVAKELPQGPIGPGYRRSTIFHLLQRCNDLRNAWYHVDVSPTLANAHAAIRELVNVTKTIGLTGLDYLTKLEQRLKALEKGPFLSPEARELAAAREQMEELRREAEAHRLQAAERKAVAERLEKQVYEIGRVAATKESLERDLETTRAALEEAREAQRRAEREAEEADAARARFEQLKSARVEAADDLVVGARWPHGKGRTALRLDRDFRNVLDFQSGRLLSDSLGAEASEGVVREWLRVLRRGGQVWMDDGGYCCAYDQSLQLVYLGRLDSAGVEGLGGG